MSKYKKHWLLIVTAMLILILLPVSFASDANSTEMGLSDDSSSDILASDDECCFVVENTNMTIDEGEDVEIEGEVLLFYDYSDPVYYYDELNLQYSFTDSNGINQVVPFKYHEDYSADPFSFTIKNLTYKDSPYIITISAIEDDLYDDYLVYGDPLQPLDVYVNIISKEDPSPEIPAYGTFVPEGQIYVSSQRGSDSNNGSEEAPFLTIQKALDQNRLLGGNYEVIVESGEYVFDDYYTILDNVSINGRGKVKIRNDGAYYLFFLQGTLTAEFKNLIMTDGQSGAISGSNTVNGLFEPINEGKVLNIINCTFKDNFGQMGADHVGAGVIKSYSKTTILNSTFINNEAIGTQTDFQGLINLPDGSLTMSYCYFIDNTVYDNTCMVYSAKRSEANFNFWGTNNGPADVKLGDNVKVKTWLVLDGGIEDGEIVATENYTVNAIVKYTNSTNIYKALDIPTPNVNVTFKAEIGSVTPSEVTVSKNVAESTYTSSRVGEEEITLLIGNVELSKINFNINAPIIDRIYVSVNGSDSNVGTIDSPLRYIKSALIKNNESGGNKTIYILPGTYNEKNLEIADEVTIIGEYAIIDAGKTDKILTVSKDTKIYGLKFVNGFSDGAGSAINHNAGNLEIYESSFENNDASAVMTQSTGSFAICNSTFANNTGDIIANSLTVIDNCTFTDAVNISNSAIVSNSRFRENKRDYAIYIAENNRSEVNIKNNEFISNNGAIYVLNSPLTLIENNTFDGYNKSAICINNNSNIKVADNIFLNSDEYALDIVSSDVDLKNNTISNNSAINIDNSTITNAFIVFIENKTVKVSDGIIQINATVTDDMGNVVNGGVIIFDEIGEADVVNGEAHIFENLTDGDYEITGSSVNFPDATINTGLLRVNVPVYWFIGDVGYETLADAINASQVDDVIKGIPGVYEYEQINIGHRTRPSEPWVINKQITITSLTDEPVILSALGENIFDIDYYSNVTVKNIIFMNANNPIGWGGAIHSMGKNTIVVDNCTFRNNYAEDGAAIHAWGNLYIKDSLFIDNEARVYAGAVFKDGDGNFTVENCRFINNTAYTYAGAVYSMGYSEIIQTFTNVTFEGNDATCGGALFTAGKNVTFTNCNFTDNRAVDKDSGYEPLGGAVYVHNGATKFVNVNFVDNYAEGNGGALELDNSASSVVDASGRHITIHWAILENCLIENNTALGYGGAIFTEEFRTYVNITDCLIKGNTAKDCALFVNLYSFYTLDNVTVENNRNTEGDSLVYTYGLFSIPEPYYAATTINNCEFKGNVADIVITTLTEYSNVTIKDSTFEGHCTLVASNSSIVNLTNNKELSQNGNVSVINYNGTLSLKNNTFANPIYSNGIIDTPTFVVIIGNETHFETIGDIVIDAVVLDDNNNRIIGGDLVFFVNNKLIPAVLENTTFIANYTVVPSNQTINAIYEDLGLLDITSKYGIIIGRAIPQIIVSDMEFNITGEFRASLTYDGIPIPNENLVLTVNSKDYKLKTDSNGTANITIELPYGKYVGVVKFNGSDEFTPAEAKVNITVNKYASQIKISVSDIGIGEDAVINITLPKEATGNIIVTVGEKDYLRVADNGNIVITIPNLPIGDYIVLADYHGDDKYLNSSDMALFKVSKNNLALEVESNKTNINVKLPADADGNITVVIDNNETFVLPVVDGSVNIPLDNLSQSIHVVEIKYSGDDKYAAASHVEVVDLSSEVIVKNDTAIEVESNKTNINVKLPGDATGNVIVVVDNNETFVLPVVDGSVNIPLDNLSQSVHVVEIKYPGDDKYAPVSHIEIVDLSKDAKKDVPLDVETNNTDIAVKLPADATGNVVVIVDNKDSFVLPVVDGSVDIHLDNLSEAAHIVEIRYVGDDKYAANYHAVLVDLSKKEEGTAKADTVIVVDKKFTRVATDYYAGERGAFFYAVLKDANGNPLANKTVQIAVNGPIYNVTTDEQGRAGLQVNLAAANTYTYALSFQGDDAYNAAPLASSKLTVTKKSTSITAANKAFKAKAKTKSISVTLKTVKNPYNGKTYLKAGKKLTLKINGKTYTAKTNAKGVAKFNIKLTKKGKYAAVIKFAGDKTYKASSKRIIVTIK